MDNKCPLCGKNTSDDELFCKDCQYIAEHSDSIGIEDQNKRKGTPNKDKYKNWDEDDSQPKKSKKNSVIVIILIVLCLGVGTVGSYNYLKDKESLNTETAYWEQCVDEGTQLSYSKYLVQYPEGKFSNDAKSKIEKIKLIEQQEWEALKKNSNIESCILYIDKNPNSPYLQEVKILLDSLSWIDALTTNTKSSYQSYIEKINAQELLGRYDSLAYAKYDYLTLYRKIEGKELDKLKVLLTNLFNNLSVAKYQKVQQSMLPTLNVYYDKSDVNRTEVVKLVQRDLNTKKIKSIKYIPNLSNLDVIADTSGVSFVTIPFRKEITFSNKKQKKQISSDTVKLELDSKSQIRAIYK